MNESKEFPYISPPEEKSKFPSYVFKTITYILLTAIIGFIGYYAVLVFSPSFFDSLRISKVPSDAYFRPPQTGDAISGIQGKIGRVFSPDFNPSAYDYELLDSGGERIGYLISETNDLALSVGFDVEIDGNLRPKSEDGYDVYLVETIKLK